MWNTIGHTKAVNILQRALAGGRLSHAYLLVGPRHIGKMTLALDLARAGNCLGETTPCSECDQCDRTARGVHADVRLVGLEKSPSGGGRTRVNVGIDQVREVQREASLKPYEGRCRTFIFEDATRLSAEAANALLKTLEEPPDQTLLLLLATDKQALPLTVVSRCQTLELRPAAPSLIANHLVDYLGVDADKADEIARLSDGRPGWAVRAAQNPEMLQQVAERLDSVEQVGAANIEERFEYAASLASVFGRDREAAREELTVWLEWWRDLLLTREDTPGFVKHVSRLESIKEVAEGLTSSQVAGAVGSIRRTMDLLERNVNARLALEGLMLALPRGARQPEGGRVR